MSIKNNFLLSLLFSGTMVYCADVVEEPARDVAIPVIAFDTEHLRLSLRNTNYYCLNETLSELVTFVKDDTIGENRLAILGVITTFFAANQTTYQIHHQMVNVLSIFAQKADSAEESVALLSIIRSFLPKVNPESCPDLVRVCGTLSKNTDDISEIKLIYSTLMSMLKDAYFYPGLHEALTSATYDIACRLSRLGA